MQITIQELPGSLQEFEALAGGRRRRMAISQLYRMF